MSEADFVNTFIGKQRDYMQDFLSRLIMAEANVETLNATIENLTTVNQNLQNTLEQLDNKDVIDRLHRENNQLREHISQIQAQLDITSTERNDIEAELNRVQADLTAARKRAPKTPT